MGSSSSKPSKKSQAHRSIHPAVPRKDHKDASYPVKSNGNLINGWRPWGGGAPAGPVAFGVVQPQILTQMAIYDHMYTYGLLQFADYIKKVIALTRSYQWMRDQYFSTNSHACWNRLERGKKWAANSKKQDFQLGLLAFYGDPMYGSQCDWRHVANVIMPLVGIDPKRVSQWQYPQKHAKWDRPPSTPSAAEFEAAKF